MKMKFFKENILHFILKCTGYYKYVKSVQNSCMCTLTEGIGNHSILIFCNSYKLIFGLYIDIDIDIISYIVWTEQKVVRYMAKIQKDGNSK
jgi:hypothetical protein